MDELSLKVVHATLSKIGPGGKSFWGDDGFGSFSARYVCYFCLHRADMIALGRIEWNLNMICSPDIEILGTATWSEEESRVMPSLLPKRISLSIILLDSSKNQSITESIVAKFLLLVSRENDTDSHGTRPLRIEAVSTPTLRSKNNDLRCW